MEGHSVLPTLNRRKQKNCLIAKIKGLVDKRNAELQKAEQLSPIQRYRAPDVQEKIISKLIERERKL